jgi:membrane fusion protein, multidrug efflux system
MIRGCLLLAVFGLLSGSLVGCAKNAPQAAPSQQLVLPVSQPLDRNVTDFKDFTGRTDPVNSVNIVPRVTGYLVKEPFKEGSEVKAGALLFEIDPRPYKAQLDQAEGQVNLYQAQLKLAKATLARDVEISKTPGAVSAQQLDQDRASVEQAESSVKAARASLEVYKLNLSFCSVTSPIDGKIGRYFLTLGNLVNQDQTLLTTIVSLDPMYAYFDMDETTYLETLNAVNQGKIIRYAEGSIPVYMALANETGYPHEGKINFVNNQVNPTTASISVRAVFPNPRPASGFRVLAPGMFVRIHLPIGQPYPAMLVIDRAIVSEQAINYVYVVDPNNTLRKQRVTTGALQADGLRVIRSGLKKDDWVVVGSLLQLRDRMKVGTEKGAMPTLAAGTEAAAAANAQNPPDATSQPGPAGAQPGQGAGQQGKGGQEQQGTAQPTSPRGQGARGTGLTQPAAPNTGGQPPR